ncbi:MAG: hypothetical protein EBV38_04035 [Burkholderiaceae bacterium]|nr:hypothetical protein [Burkholderiaceae bacterium]
MLEFGSGQSTIVIAHALAKLANANPKNAYKLYSIDGSKHWTEVTRAKIPKDLQSFVDLRYSKPIITRFNDRICHRHEQLPNITPDFIYLDGPSPYDVEGVDACGIGFTQEDGNNRSAMSCDVLLYEPFVSTGCTIVIDTRMNNSSFVIKNLQRNWKHAWDSVFKVHVLELTDWKKR